MLELQGAQGLNLSKSFDVTMFQVRYRGHEECPICRELLSEQMVQTVLTVMKVGEKGEQAPLLPILSTFSSCSVAGARAFSTECEVKKAADACTA